MRNDCIALLNQKSKDRISYLLFSQEKQEDLKVKERRLMFRNRKLYFSKKFAARV